MAPVSRYLYSTVRVVPNPATGEFANLAAIAGSDETGEWHIRTLTDESRVLRFCGANAISAAHDFLARTGELFAWHEITQFAESDTEASDSPASEVCEEWLLDLAARNRETVQLSTPQPVLAETVAEAFNLIFPRVTVSVAESEARQGLTKWRAFSDLNKTFIKSGLAPHVSQRAPLLAHGFHAAMDFVVASSTEAVQLSQTWSFQGQNHTALNRDVKAWGWTVEALREHGGSVQLRSGSVPIAQNVPAHVVLIAPQDDNPGGADALAEAERVFSELEVSIHRLGLDDLGPITSEAKAVLGTSPLV